jgi:uncharacterized protein (DUF1015 family)
MPDFRPFRALRYAAEDLGPLVAPPYDVLSDSDVDALRQRSPHNIVRVDVPRGDNRYRRAAAQLADWESAGLMVRDEVDTFTIYRMRFVDATGVSRDLAGVLGGLAVVDEGAGGVLPHERTTPKASTDRLDLTRATTANLSPVWGLSLARGLTALLADAGEPLGKVVDEGVQHVVERVSDPERIAAIRQVLAVDDVLIADGHHRYGISRTYRDEVRAATGRSDTAAEQTLTFVNELVADQLSVAAIHRLYADITLEQLHATLAGFFALSPTEWPSEGTLATMEAEGNLVLVGPDAAWRLKPLPGAFEGERALDGAWLETAMAPTSATVSYQHGLDEAVAAVASGAAAAAVLIRPVSIPEIERTAREGLLMPPKSTFFTPKLKTGFVLRPLG